MSKYNLADQVDARFFGIGDLVVLHLYGNSIGLILENTKDYEACKVHMFNQVEDGKTPYIGCSKGTEYFSWDYMNEWSELVSTVS